MDLTAKNKAHVDSLPYAQLLSKWRFAPIGDPWFQGETGTYWGELLQTKDAEERDEHTKASKHIGWEKPE